MHENEAGTELVFYTLSVFPVCMARKGGKKPIAEQPEKRMKLSSSSQTESSYPAPGSEGQFRQTSQLIGMARGCKP
eukprot:3629222-Amphidinium_carterae.1